MLWIMEVRTSLFDAYLCLFLHKSGKCALQKKFTVNIPNKVHCRDTYFILIFLLE